MKQTFLPDHFPQTKSDLDLPRKRPSKDSESIKSLKNSAPTPSPSPAFSLKPLSANTQFLINTLDLPQHSFSKTPDEILSMVRPREKYEDLLDPVRSLQFPYKYKRLATIQEYLDSIINSARMRKLPIAFQNLKQAIESTFSVSVDIEHVQKIIFLCPGFYKLRWIVENGEEGLLVDLPENSNYNQFLLHNRSSVFRGELMKMVKKWHSTHLATLRVKFDPDKAKTWHSSFNLHEVPDVPEAPLPDRNPENPTVAKASLGKQLRACRLITLCTTLSEIFDKNRTKSIFLKSLTKKIQRCKSSKESEKIIENDVIELSEMFMTWISLFHTPSGAVIRINKSFTPKHCSVKIREKYGVLN